MIKYFCFFAFIVLAINTEAQQVRLKKWTLGSAGSVNRSAKYNLALSQTIGQSSLVGHFTSGSIQVLQGFQHPFIQNATANKIGVKNFSFFPNPSTGKITINVLNNGSNEKITVALFSLSGILIARQTIDHKGNSFDLDYSSISKGAYGLKIIGDNTRRASFLLILK